MEHFDDMIIVKKKNGVELTGGPSENFGYKNVLLNKVALLNYMHALQQFTGL